MNSAEKKSDKAGFLASIRICQTASGSQGTPNGEIAWEKTVVKVGWVFRKSPVVWYRWVLRREVVSMMRDDVGEAKAPASKHIIYPGM